VATDAACAGHAAAAPSRTAAPGSAAEAIAQAIAQAIESRLVIIVLLWTCRAALGNEAEYNQRNAGHARYNPMRLAMLNSWTAESAPSFCLITD